jgi:hypothetical protein
VPVWLADGASGYNQGNPRTNGVTQWMYGGAPQMSSGGWTYTLPMSGGPVETSYPPTQENGPPQQPCNVYSNWSFFDPAGSRDPLSEMITISTAGNPTCNQQSIMELDYGGDLDYGGSVPPNTATPNGLTVTARDGTRFLFAGGDGLFPTKVEDRNGNIIQISDTRTNGQVTQVNETDTLGRPLLSLVGFGTTGNTVSVAGVVQPYSLSWESQSHNFDPGAVVLSTRSPSLTEIRTRSSTILLTDCLRRLPIQPVQQSPTHGARIRSPHRQSSRIAWEIWVGVSIGMASQPL